MNIIEQGRKLVGVIVVAEGQVAAVAAARTELADLADLQAEEALGGTVDAKQVAALEATVAAGSVEAIGGGAGARALERNKAGRAKASGDTQFVRQHAQGL